MATAPNNNPLFTLLTVNEASRLFFVSKETIHYHINKGNVQARKADSALRGVWLVSYASMCQLYGIPKKLPC